MNIKQVLYYASAAAVGVVAATLFPLRGTAPAEAVPPPVVVPIKLSYASADLWSYDLVIVEHAGEKVLFMRGPGHHTYGPLPSHWLDSAAKSQKKE